MKPKRGVESVPAINPLHGQFGDMVEAVLGLPEKAKNSVVKDKATVETWAIPLQSLYENKDIRLDASHYDQQTAAAIKDLENSAYPLKPLADIAKIILPSQFVRIWAKDKAHGIQYVNATDLMSLSGIGTPSGEPRYLSRQTQVNFDELIIREGWLLVTCSGTIGRVFYVPKRMDGWIATHDLIRIIPNPDMPVGFLHSYLLSSIAQKQILGHTHGGQIDHVTHHQIRQVLVPIISEDKMRDIHDRTMQALKLREKAIAALMMTAEDMEALINDRQ